MLRLKKTLILIAGLYAFAPAIAQYPKTLSFGTDSTLEVMTWNLEQFPKEGQTTMNYVAGIIRDLDVDVIAFQEIGDQTLFNQMVMSLPGYEGYAVPGSYGDLAYIYKTSSVQVNRLYQIYTGSSYWAPFPRSPLVLDFKFRNLNFITINNHLKCCGDGELDTGDPEDEENRRYRANLLLRQYVNEFFPDEMVFIVGDMNDELTDEPSDNVFQIIISDAENYLFADMDIALGSPGNWSYPTWPSHLDHIAITGELFPAFENPGSVIQTIKAEQGVPGGWSVYEDNVSDHRPVAIKLLLPAGLGSGNHPLMNDQLTCSPNPVRESATITIPPFKGPAKLIISNAAGKQLCVETINEGTSSFLWSTGNLSAGVYFVRLVNNGKISRALRAVVIR